MVAARRSGASARGADAVLGPARTAHGLWHEHPRRTPEDARAGWCRPAKAPRPSRRVVGLRADGVRRGAARGAARARALGRTLARPTRPARRPRIRMAPG